MIKLSEGALKEIVNSLVLEDPESRQQYLLSINNESGEGTENSSPQQKWDYRYNTILKVARKYGLKSGKLTRGRLWEAIYVIGPDDEIYIFFSHKNMRSIIKHGKDNHYLKLLNLLNQAVDDLEPLDYQMVLPILNEEDRDIENLRKQAIDMLKALKTNPTKVIVFAFDISFISTVKAFVFNTRHEVVWEKNLSELIEINYKSVLDDKMATPETQESRTERRTKDAKKKIVRLKNQ